MNYHSELQALILDLIGSDYFWGIFLANMEKHFEENLPAPCGVSIDTKIHLWINPKEFFDEKWGRQGQLDLLKHECEHIMKLHVTRGKNFDHMQFNIAADITINDNYPSLQEFGYHSAKLGFDSGLTSEEYYDLVSEKKKQQEKQNQQNQQGGENGDGDQQSNQLGEDNPNYDPHKTWEKSLGKDVAEDTIKRKIQDAMEQTKKNHGNIPNSVLTTLEKLTSNQVNWKREIKTFANSVLSRDIRKIRTKLNRRYGLAAPGKKKKWLAHLGVAIDTSASMSEKELSIIFAEIVYLKKTLGYRITVIEVDTQVQRVYELDEHTPWEVKGRGGTVYQPAFDKAKELKVDALIYCGDMDSADTPKEPNFKTLWVVVGNQRPPADFGSVVKVQV